MNARKQAERGASFRFAPIPPALRAMVIVIGATRLRDMSADFSRPLGLNQLKRSESLRMPRCVIMSPPRRQPHIGRCGCWLDSLKRPSAITHLTQCRLPHAVGPPRATASIPGSSAQRTWASGEACFYRGLAESCQPPPITRKSVTTACSRDSLSWRLWSCAE